MMEVDRLDESLERKRRTYDDLWEEGEVVEPEEKKSKSSHSDISPKDRERSHYDKSRKDKDRERDRERDRQKEREREKERERRHRDYDRERDRDRERERERDRERNDKFRSSSSSHKSRSRSKSPSNRSKSSKSKSEEKTNQPAPELEITPQTKPQTEEEYKLKVSQQLEQLQTETDEEAEIRKRRERRMAILAKYKQDNSQQEVTQPSQLSQSSSTAPLSPPSASMTEPKSPATISPTAPLSPTDAPLSPPMELVEHVEKGPLAQSILEQLDKEVEGLEQEQEEEKMKPTEAEPKKDKEFDMFSESPTFEGAVPKLSDNAIYTSANTEVTDDAEGYYCYRPGEVLAGRFSLVGSFGKGVFSTVFRARDLQNNDQEVAVKVVRNNDVMKKTGMKEIQILRELEAADPSGKYNCIRLVSHFEARDHLALVFEAMGGNLRDILRKYGTKIGLSIKAVRVYAHKLFLALKLLKKCRILHADIKLDNILVNEQKTSIKLADFGSAFNASENSLTPLLVSRFYRAPEIILGLPYSYPIDMWAVGCCLYELATGKICFPGRSNNDMLHLFMEALGPIPKRLTKKGQFVAEHFDDNGAFKRVIKDKLTQKEYVKMVTITKQTREIKDELLSSPFDLSAEEKRMIAHLHDLLSQIFTFDPVQRISVEDALRHPFITGIEPQVEKRS